MTACPDPTRLTAAASGEDLGAERHAADCHRCRRTLDAELGLRALAARLPRAPLDTDRRRALEASLLALTDADEHLACAPRRRWRYAAVAIALVAALALIAGWLNDRLTSSAARAPQAGLPPRPNGPAPPMAVVAPTVVPLPPAGPAIIAGGGARFERHATADRDLVVVQDGTVAFDAVGVTRPLELTGGTAGQTIIRAEGARVEVRASRGTIHSVHVFAGSVEVVSDGKTVVVTAGATWEMPVAPASNAANGWTSTAAEAGVSAAPEGPESGPPGDSPAVAAARAFAAGWAALHADQPATAVAAFRRAIADPAMGEDASYWLAIAHMRAGDIAPAAAAFESFVVAYPASPHAGAAHLALIRLLGSTDPSRAEHHRKRASLDPDPRVREAATGGK